MDWHMGVRNSSTPPIRRRILDRYRMAHRKGLDVTTNNTNRVLTLEMIREAAKAAVEEMGPDFRYANGAQTCSYVPETDPRFPLDASDLVADGAAVTGCLVGEVLRRTNFLTDEIAESTDSIFGLVENGFIPGVRVDNDVKHLYLSILQHNQDHGTTWREAYNRAEAGVSE